MRAADLHRLARQVRDLALVATANTGADAVTGGQLAVVEDLMRNPDSTISEVTARTGLAQSLVSRIVRDLVEHDLAQSQPDAVDRRRRRVTIDPRLQSEMRRRGDGDIGVALVAATPALTESERVELRACLERAAELLSRAPAGRPETGPSAES